MSEKSRREMMQDFFKPDICDEGAHEEPLPGVSKPDSADASSVAKREESDPVQHPKHYKQYPVEVIDIIRHVLGPEGFRAYCVGNELKYRLRAGDKGDAAQDLAKAMKYREFREEKR